MKKLYDLIVIGGGASGMMAAGVAAARGKSVLILEKNEVLGKKLAITGGARCNITNATYDTNAFLDKFPQTKKFLYSPFSQFAVEETFHFFQNTLNLPLTTQAKNRVFPTSEKATDVVKALGDYIKEGDVDIVLSSPVTGMTQGDGIIVSVESQSQSYYGKKFVLSTGGLTAPDTGSTGDGFALLEKLGHTIKSPDTNIVPLSSDALWIHNCSGTVLTNVKISFWQDDKRHIQKTGDILLTHFGISGPTVLNNAFEVSNLLQGGSVTARIDLFGDLDEAQLDKKLLNLFDDNKNKQLGNVLPTLLPRSLCREILEFAETPNKDTIVNEVSKEHRKILVKLCKNLTFPITGKLGYEKAIIADGGVIPQEVDFSTMTSRLYPNLYLIGDTISINRPTGGYSLQLCWTTGWIAGNDC